MLHKITALLKDPLSYVIAFLLVLNFVQPIIASHRDMQYDSQVITGEENNSRPAFLDTVKLTYAEFRKLQDSRFFRNSFRGSIARNKGRTKSYSTSFIDVAELDECHTCITPEDYYDDKHPKTTSYYLVLPGYALTDDHSTFYMRNGQPRLEYPVWDRVDTFQGGGLQRSGHYADKALPFRFSYSNEEEEQKGNGQVLIPVSQTTYQNFQIPAFCLFILLGLAGLYLCFIRPLEVLYRVAKGIVFTQQNVRALFVAAWIWICAPFAIVFLRFMLRLLFSRTITSDVQLLFWDALREYQFTLIGGLILLAIATAFRKGLSLQNEQNLTI